MASSSPDPAAVDGDEPPRVKLLCSFGGSILPRPHDGRLRYVGGETRIVSLPRDVRYDDLMARMRELFDAATVLKYQQPDEDLDALVSVVNDDDVTNMMEEHDKLGSTPDGFIRLRVFLFPHPDLALPPLDDDRDTDRRYVDALNSVLDGSSDFLPSRVTIPRRPSYGQLYPDMDGSWSPAAYYSPGQLTPREQYREFSPSPGRFDHASPFVEAGSVVWAPPPGGTVPEMAGFPGNLGHSHGGVYEGSAGCEQCRVVPQRGQQDSWYHDPPRPRHYPQFHLDQPGVVAPEVCGAHFFTPSCPECVRQREATPYMMNQDVAFEHEPLEHHTFYSDFHVRDRNWVSGLPLHFGHHPEDVRSSRNEQQYVVDGPPAGYASAHGGGLFNGNSVSSTYLGYPDSRYTYAGNEPGNEMLYPDPYGALPPLRIPKQGEGGARYNNFAPPYGQAFDSSSSAHGSRRNVYAPVGAGPPAYEPQSSSVVQGNGYARMGYPQDVPDESPRASHVEVTDNFKVTSFEQNGSISPKRFPVDAVPDYPPKLNTDIPVQENLHLSSQGSGTGGNLGAMEEDGKTASLSCGVAKKHLPGVAVDQVTGGTVDMDGLTGNAGGEVKNDAAAKLDANTSTSVGKGADAASDPIQIVSNKDEQLGGDNGSNKSNTSVLTANASSHPDKNSNHAIECFDILPEVIASIKQIAFDVPNTGENNVEADAAADASPQHQTLQHESPELIDCCKDEHVDSDGEHALDTKIEPTNAEKEALAKGLQAIRNDDLEEIRELGSGAYGAVFHGKWKGTDVAIKRIKASCFSGKPSERERLISDFWKEALILSSLHHPNVVAFYGVVRDGPDGTLATVTEFMINGSLKQFLQKKDRTIDRRKRLIIAMDASFGMEYLHGRNIVHFDLKCENLLVNMRDPHRPICKIGDLGLSKVKQKTLVSGGVRGTLPWMAPELLSGKSKMVTEKVDVYSFGVVMWELLTGEDPYADMHCASIIGGIVNNTLRPQIPSWCDPEWRSLMESCWSSDPNERPSFLEISQKLRKMAVAMNLK